ARAAAWSAGRRRFRARRTWSTPEGHRDATIHGGGMPSLSGLPERFAGPDRYPLAPSVDGLEDPSLSSEERPHSSALPVLLPERSRAKPPAPSAAARDRHGQLSPDEAQCTAGMTHPRSG